MASGAATLVAVPAAAAQHARKYDLLAPEFEVLDPNPDLHALFAEYNAMFFDGKLAGCEVKWSSRMTLCAGLCSFQPRSGFCSIRLSEPLLKLRSRGDLINTLLHEMIHAYVFVFSPVKDHDDHGAVFQSHMQRINTVAGTHITVFHTFHDEVDSYRQHWWKCDGPCQRVPPYYGVVKRAMNRPPCPSDRWWADHEKQCGGRYTKIRDPPGFKEKQAKKQAAAAKRKLNQQQKQKREAAAPSVKRFFTSNNNAAASSESPSASAPTAQSEAGKGGAALPKVPTTTKKPEPSAKTKKPRVVGPTPPQLPTLQSDTESFPVVFTMDDGALFVAGDLQALFQQPPGARLDAPAALEATRLQSNAQVVDLTLSDDDENVAQAAQSRRIVARVCVDVIEVDDE